MSHDGVGLRAVMRSAAFLTAGVLAVPLLSACSADDEGDRPAAAQDIAPASRDQVADGGTLRWAVDAVPETLNAFQADADAATSRVAGAVLPSMYRLDANGRPQINPAYLESAKVVGTEPKQVVLYKLNQQAVWSDGREIGAADFAAQWRALSGKDAAYWTARNAGYDRIEKIERGKNNLEVRVTFARPYADWKSLFSPLYPKSVMGTADSFNDGARRKLKVSAGPFAVKKVDVKGGQVQLTRNPRWWGSPTKLSEIDLVAVARDKRATALAADELDMAEIDPADAERITAARGRSGPLKGASATGTQSPGAGRDKGEKDDSGEKTGKSKDEKARDDGKSKRESDSDSDESSDGDEKDTSGAEGSKAKAADQQAALSAFVVRKSLEPAYTQLALNGSEGPLADERVRRAVARALDRKELAKVVLKPLGLPAEPVGSHLALIGQAAYSDNSGALGGQDTAEARALLADAGWVPGGPVTEQKKTEKAAGSKGKKADTDDSPGDDGTYIVGEDNKPSEADRDLRKDPKDHTGAHERTSAQSGIQADEQQAGKQYAKQGGAQGAYAPKGTAAPAGAASGALAKDGKPLTLRFVLPSGQGSESLRAVADRIAQMLQRIGIRTDISKVSDASYFKDHIASGQYDLALYSWPGSAYPATDARPIYSKPVPAADGSLSVEQNYTRVGTDQVDQLFDQALSTLDEGEERSLVRKADARIWAAAGSIPLYQRPQLTAVRTGLANAGAFGFQTPVYEDMGFLKKGAHPVASPSKTG
ncbi:ABC transporter family substrate-binding protein [Streptomyces sp. NBC_01281]|uniref:ABC transporter family substrate-binding protein n=1 Tax=unclassified Streptomyces TaxID=2593676 RepID=UPI0013B9AFF4|nr:MULTISPECIES: ABC transporter family substrate-binding protein [unclassified Streptomyces]NEB31066.1 ABC transporter family substrate-binding protein [Streptomyces sp. SID14446]WSK66045.1 ABC transporter family substrate-binding protein [Streptomyces sp. NBC_01281]